MVGTDPSVSAAIARLEARLDGQDASIAEIKSDVKILVANWNNAKGGWKFAVVLGSIIGGFVALVGSIWAMTHR